MLIGPNSVVGLKVRALNSVVDASVVLVATIHVIVVLIVKSSAVTLVVPSTVMSILMLIAPSGLVRLRLPLLG